MTGLSFHERMGGFVTRGWHDYNEGLRMGRVARDEAEFELDIIVDDIDRFLDDDELAARPRGVVRCALIGPGDIEVVDGSSFNMFVPAGERRGRRMLYRLWLRDRDGVETTLSGFKDVADDPNYDVWADTSTLLVRFLAGHVSAAQEAGSGEQRMRAMTLATGALLLSRLDFARQMLSFRGHGGSRSRRAAAVARFQHRFVGELMHVYHGKVRREGNPDFPDPVRSGAEPLQGFPEGEWHDLPRRPGLRRRIITFRSADGMPLSLHNVRGAAEPARGPVVVVHGSGVRANLFYDAPLAVTLVDVLVGAGYDVWLSNWRGSIDAPFNPYTLDRVAVLDHPRTFALVRELTGAEKVKAVVHCQGSTSFMLTLIAGLLPEVTHVVSNAVSLHVRVPALSQLKMAVVAPLASRLMPGMDPQWAVRPPSALAAGLARWTRLLRRECREPVCAFSNYAYGVGPEVLWRHDNLDTRTHDEWLPREWGWVPFSFFAQMRRSARRGSIVPVDDFAVLPADPLTAPLPTDARITFMAGSANRCFLPASQEQSFAHFDALQPGRHRLAILDGYGHLDPFFSARSATDVYPVVLAGLESSDDERPSHPPIGG